MAELCHRSGVRKRAFQLHALLENVTRVKKLKHLLVEQFIVPWIVVYTEIRRLLLSVLAFLSETARILTVGLLEDADEVLVANMNASLYWQAYRDLTPVQRERKLTKRLQMRDVLVDVEYLGAIVIVLFNVCRLMVLFCLLLRLTTEPSLL